MSSHAKATQAAIEEFTTAVASDDRDAAYAALGEALTEDACAHKGGMKAASASAADADVVAACDSALSTVGTVARSAQPAKVGAAGDNIWDLFLQLAPSVLEWLKARFGG